MHTFSDGSWLFVHRSFLANTYLHLFFTKCRSLRNPKLQSLIVSSIPFLVCFASDAGIPGTCLLFCHHIFLISIMILNAVRLIAN